MELIKQHINSLGLFNWKYIVCAAVVAFFVLSVPQTVIALDSDVLSEDVELDTATHALAAEGYNGASVLAISAGTNQQSVVAFTAAKKAAEAKAKAAAEAKAKADAEKKAAEEKAAAEKLALTQNPTPVAPATSAAPAKPATTPTATKSAAKPAPTKSGSNPAGIPSKYTVVNSFTVKAYAYSGGGTTASGMRAAVGRIAVDPRVIPLGTVLYVSGYGLCVAADTGGDIKGNTVDLYKNTERECLNWGVRYVTCYILK